MNKSRISREYFNRVQEFMTFASKQTTSDGMILCPCVKCVNSTFLAINVVRLHLESFGICKGYQPWDFHRESSFTMTSTKMRNSHVQESSNDAYSQVKGLEHFDRVCGLGFIPTQSGWNTKTKNKGIRIQSIEEDSKYQEMRNDLDVVKAQVAIILQQYPQLLSHASQVLIFNEFYKYFSVINYLFGYG